MKSIWLTIALVYLLFGLYAGLAYTEAAPQSLPQSNASASRKIESNQNSILLRYKWKKDEALVYRFIDGKENSKGELTDGFNFDVTLTAKSINNNGVVTIEENKLRSGQILFGTFMENEPEVMRAIYQADSCGRIINVTKTEGSDGIGSPGVTLGKDAQSELSSMTVGMPRGDVNLGIVNFCLLPKDPVKVGAVWQEQVSATSAAFNSDAITTFEGKLTGLDHSGMSDYAVIESKLNISSAPKPYLAEIRFDIQRGQVVSIGWQAIPAERPDWRRRLELLHAGSQTSAALSSLAADTSIWESLAFFVVFIGMVIFLGIPWHRRSKEATGKMKPIEAADMREFSIPMPVQYITIGVVFMLMAATFIALGHLLLDREWLGFVIAVLFAWFLIPGWHVRFFLFRTPRQVVVSNEGLTFLKMNGQIDKFNWEELKVFKTFGSFFCGASFRFQRPGERKRAFVVYSSWIPHFKELVADIQAHLSKQSKDIT